MDMAQSLRDCNMKEGLFGLSDICTASIVTVVRESHRRWLSSDLFNDSTLLDHCKSIFQI